jgi:hypothetical protein
MKVTLNKWSKNLIPCSLEKVQLNRGLLLNLLLMYHVTSLIYIKFKFNNKNNKIKASMK